MPAPATPQAEAYRQKAQSLTQDANAFVDTLARLTGLDKNVIKAWARAEGAYAPGGTGGYNFLNLRAKSNGASYSGVHLTGTSPRGFAQFANPHDAAVETAHWINTMPNYRPIRATAGQSSQVQLTGIASSPWDSGHYGNGQGLFSAYHAVTAGGGILSGVTGKIGDIIAWGNKPARSGIPGLDPNLGPSVGDVVGAPIKTAEAVGKVATWAFNPQHWLRIGYIVFGSVLVVGGAFLLARSVGAPTPNLSLPKTPEGPSDFEAGQMYEGNKRDAAAQRAADRKASSEQRKGLGPTDDIPF